MDKFTYPVGDDNIQGDSIEEDLSMMLIFTTYTNKKRESVERISP